MNIAAIYHRPMSEYAHALNEHTYVFRLRTARSDLHQCSFHYADRAEMSPDLSFTGVKMPLVRRDALFDWYELILHTPYLRIAYYFMVSDAETTLCYAGDCFEPTEELARSDYFQLPFNLRADRLSVPSWLNDAVVYNIFPDSFASGKCTISGEVAESSHQGEACHSLLGGTIQGITDNLDYIKDLGCNCIYLNPIFAATSYHKYDLLDYFHIDPTRGSDEDFRTLVQTAHAMDMRVIIDGVFNHIGYRHPFFQDVLAKGKDSAYYHWFYDLPEHPRFPEEGEEPDYLCFAYVPQMPKTNTANKDMQDYFCAVGQYWIRHFDVDGWRLDVANEMDDGFLRAFRDAVKETKAEAVVIGEVWENANHYLLGNAMDGAMNYDFRRFCDAFFAKGSMDAKAFDVRVSQLLMRYPKQATVAQLNLLDSHDVSRFLTLCAGDRARMELAILFQMTFIGMPCIFYGDEKGFVGTTESEYRQAMNFDLSDDLQACYQTFINLRKNHPALRYGDYQTTLMQGHVYGYTRSYEGKTVTVVMNAGNTAVSVSSPQKILLQKGFECGLLQPMGYIVY